MSKENVETVRAMITAFPAVDKEEMLAALPAAIPEFCDPEIEFVETPERVDARTFHGHDGVLEAFERWLDMWDEYEFEPERFEDHGDDVLLVAREQGRGASGAAAEARLYTIFTMREGKILRYREYYDETAARAALGD